MHRIFWWRQRQANGTDGTDAVGPEKEKQQQQRDLVNSVMRKMFNELAAPWIWFWWIWSIGVKLKICSVTLCGWDASKTMQFIKFTYNWNVHVVSSFTTHSNKF